MALWLSRAQSEDEAVLRACVVSTMPRVPRSSEAGVGPREAASEEDGEEAGGGAEETQADADYRRSWEPRVGEASDASRRREGWSTSEWKDWREARKTGSVAGSEWSERAEKEPWGQKWKTEETDRPGDGGKDDKPPTWNGKEPRLQTYIRKVNLWCAYTRTPENRRGIRLLAGLDGDAFDKMELITPEELVRPDSVTYFLS